MEGKQHDWTDQDFKCFVNMANSLIKLYIILFGLIKMIFAYQNEQVFFFIISLTKNNLPVEALSVKYRWWS